MNILLIFLCFFILLFIIIFIIQSTKIRKLSAKPNNKVHFYVARDKNGELNLWFGKPFRGIETWVCVDYPTLVGYENDLESFGLNIKKYDDLKWEDEPIEVFLNMDDCYQNNRR